MNVTITAAVITIVLIVVIIGIRVAKGRLDGQHVTFNRSRWKDTLRKKTRHYFKAENWEVKEGGFVGDRVVDFLVTCKLASYTIVCLDRTLNHFMSETRLLEQLEDQDRFLRNRNETLIITTDGGLGDSFFASARRRGLLIVHVDELGSVAGIIKYIEILPEALTEVERLVLERSFSACINLSHRFMAANSSEKAIEWARRAIRSRRAYSVAYYTLFSLLIGSNELDAAEEIGQEGLSYKPKDAVLFFKGLQKLAALRGNNSATVSWAERWVAAEPDNPWAHDNLAGVHQKQQNGPAAGLAISQALKLAPTNSHILSRAAKIALLNGDLASAVSHAEAWISQEPKDVGAHEFLSDVFLKQKTYDKAMAEITTALNISPDNPQLLRRASITALAGGDVMRATILAEQWLIVAPTDAWAYDHLSNVSLRASNHGRAHEANMKALELDPTNANFLRKASQIKAIGLRASNVPP